MNLSKEKKKDHTPILWKMSIDNNIYKSPISDLMLEFDKQEFGKNYAKLKFRTYRHESGGYSTEVTLRGDLDDLLPEIENIAQYRKKKYGGLSIVHRKTNNIVAEKHHYHNKFKP
jgi:hypothetical protein